jgi:O-antigen ligase
MEKFCRNNIEMMRLEKIILKFFKKELAVLWIFSVLLGLALIVLSNKNKLPLGTGDFVFVSLLALLVALYRPRWIFFLFISLIPLENVILASGFLPLQLRPYQFLGAVLVTAIAILWTAKKLKFKSLKPTWFDWTVFSIVPFSFLALLDAPEKSTGLKNNLVLLSFVVLYFLIRNFLRTKSDLAKTAFFFAGSYFVVATYGFYQVFADKFGARSFEVMFGRPNSTFAEPDWLGIFLCFALAVFMALILFFLRDKENFFVPKKYILLFIDILIFTDITLIILTLSRSAWIGAGILIIFHLFLSTPSLKQAFGPKYLFWKTFFRQAGIIFFIIIISLAIVHFGKLSKFDIFDRARSAATNEQKITIACENSSSIPEIVSNTKELEKYSCRHINLEEISDYKSQGKIVAEIFRKDPNVMTRGAIYQRSWEILEEHPFLGVGFGTITQKLGADERGSGLNESNIFLQVWAGCGILGLMAFTTIFGYLFIYAFRRVSPICPMNKIIGCPVVKDDFEKTLNFFAVLGILALIIPNLFNAGLLMGIFWLGLAIFISTQNIHSH